MSARAGGIGPGPSGLALTDRIVLAYDGLALVAVAVSPPGRRSGWIAFHLAVLAAVPLLARFRARPALGWLHLWYPVLLLPWLYQEAGALRHLFVARDLDRLVAAWDAALFPAWYLTVPPRLPVAALEALHAVYFSYYLLLTLPGMLAGRRREGAVREYVFVLTLAMLAHYVLALALPVSGPVALRAGVMPRGWLFIPLMNHLYGAFDRGGLAFPSTHVAAALVAGVYAALFYPRRRRLFGLWVLAIAVSTVLCTYHYTLDAVAGLGTGTVGLVAGRALWRARGPGAAGGGHAAGPGGLSP